MGQSSGHLAVFLLSGRYVCIWFISFCDQRRNFAEVLFPHQAEVQWHRAQLLAVHIRPITLRLFVTQDSLTQWREVTSVSIHIHLRSISFICDALIKLSSLHWVKLHQSWQISQVRVSKGHVTLECDEAVLLGNVAAIVSLLSGVKDQNEEEKGPRERSVRQLSAHLFGKTVFLSRIEKFDRKLPSAFPA